MKKETVLAKLRVSLSLTPVGFEWLVARQSLETQDSEGRYFFRQHSERWNSIVSTHVEEAVRDYFVKLGTPEEYLPHVQVYDGYLGSWIIEAAIVMSASVGTAYAILKSVSELPQIADGLEELKTRLKKEVNGAANETAREMLPRGGRSKPAPVVPNEVLSTDLIIDARPLRALTPERMRDHKIHLSVGVSRSAFTLENLGEEPLRDIRIGLFHGAEARHHWYFGDAYVGLVSLLSAHQTITRQLSTFQHDDGSRLDLDIGQPVFLDCWIQDTSGIYLFNFYLD